MVSIEVEYLLSRNFKIIDLQLLFEQIDELLQLLSRCCGVVFLDLDELDAQL